MLGLWGFGGGAGGLEGRWIRELEAKIARLEKELHKARTILDVQGKVAGLLGFSLEDGKNS